MRLFRAPAFQIAAVLLLAAAWKILFIFWDVIPFNSDEAVVALMARHILMGERPVFFYGQAYMGSLDAFLVAGGFALFGQHVWVIRIVQMLLYLGTLFVVMLIGREGLGSLRAGILAALLLAIPTVNVTLYTTASLGGYGEALFIGSLALYLAIVIVRGSGMSLQKPPLWKYSLWGALVGFGLWANGLSLVFCIPSGIYVLVELWRRRRNVLSWFLLFAGIGFVTGSLPWWIFALENGLHSLVAELLGTAVAVEQGSWLARTGSHLVNFLLLGVGAIFGLRPPWNVRWLALPLLPFVLAFWVGVLWLFVCGLRRRTGSVEAAAGNDDHRAERVLLAGVGLTLLAGFLFTHFGVDPSGRYFIPLAIPLSLAAAWVILSKVRKPWQVMALAALVVGYQAWGTLECALIYPPGLTTQFYEPTIIDHRADSDLIAFLREQGETRGYTSYWVTYPLAFHSGEELIFVPRLPYHADMRYTPRDDRYAPYAQQVADSERTAYITVRSPWLDETLRVEFARLGVSWEEKTIGDFSIFYQLSRAVRPQEIGLGELRE